MWIFGKKDSNYYLKQGEKLSRSDTQKAVAMFNKAIELNPRDPGLYFRIGSLLFRTSNLREEALKTSLQYLTKATQMDPRNSMAHLVRGNVLVKLEKADDAISAFDVAIRTDPNNAAAYNARGKVRAQQQQNLGAMEDLSKASLLAGHSMHTISFRADLDAFVQASGESARAAQGQVSTKTPSRTRGDCPRCHKSFEIPDVPIPDSAMVEGEFRGRAVVEIMQCRRNCGAMYCWPDCCKMEPCRCGSQQGFIKAMVLVIP
jgi:hypothetical protein